MAALKGKVTADVVEWRVLGTHHRGRGQRLATFIGAANNVLADLIGDATGMRRFYEIKASERLDWDALNSIDYLALWQSVDEMGEAPVLPVLNRLRLAQEETRTPSSVEEYVFTHWRRAHAYKTRATELYDEYLEWMRTTRPKATPATSTAFGRGIGQLYGDSIKHKSGSIMYALAPRSLPMDWDVDDSAREHRQAAAPDHSDDCCDGDVLTSQRRPVAEAEAEAPLDLSGFGEAVLGGNSPTISQNTPSN